MRTRIKETIYLGLHELDLNVMFNYFSFHLRTEATQIQHSPNKGTYNLVINVENIVQLLLCIYSQQIIILLSLLIALWKQF